MTEWVSGNVFIRQMGGRPGLRAGDKVGGHTHNFDHTTILFTGRWRVRRWRPVVGAGGESQRLAGGDVAYHETDNFERDGPFHLLIEANSRHEFEFLGPGVGIGWCVYSHRTPRGEVSESYTGWFEAYQ